MLVNVDRSVDDSGKDLAPFTCQKRNNATREHTKLIADSCLDGLIVLKSRRWVSRGHTILLYLGLSIIDGRV